MPESINLLVQRDSAEQTLSGLEAQLQTIRFDFDKFEIRTDMEEKLKTNATLANADASIYNVKPVSYTHLRAHET